MSGTTTASAESAAAGVRRVPGATLMLHDRRVNEFGISATPGATRFIEEIATGMVERFGISRAEAAARISGFWHGNSFVTEYQLMALLHRGVDHWVPVIYGETTTPVRPADTEPAQPE